jgi:hypothetical protein
MTDSLRPELSLQGIEEHDRSKVEFVLNIPLAIHKSEFLPEYTPWKSAENPVTGTKTAYTFKFQRGETPDQASPTAILADANVPNLVLGNNILIGHSVPAASWAFVSFVKAHLARQGLSRQSLDRLSVQDLNLQGVTLTYLIDQGTRAKGEQTVQDVFETVKVLKMFHSGIKEIRRDEDELNTTVKVVFDRFTLLFYCKHRLDKCKFDSTAPQKELAELASRLLRVELVLGERYLRDFRLGGKGKAGVRRDLTKVSSWFDGHKVGLYRQIYEELVYGRLQLRKVCGAGLRHAAPDQSSLDDKLQVDDRMLVEDYLRGVSVNAGANVRHRILQALRIDLNIPWVEHKKLRCYRLDQTLAYPGDYHPPSHLAPWCFCEENWTAIKARLKEQYEEALSAGQQS